MLRFEDFELDRAAYELRRGGQVVHLERIPLDLLFLLAERHGQLVPRDEILAQVWGKGLFLDGDASINAAVRKIRRALGDDADAPRFVMTVPAKGYRFIADCEESLDTSDKPGAQPEKSRTTAPAPPGRLVWGKFIGRAEEIAALRAAIDAALGGQASLVMLVGEPGIGKTRLAEEAGAYARLRGAQMLVGHCYEGEAASPYSAFVEAIREYVSTRPDDALKAELGDGASDVAKLVPEIRRRLPDLTPSPAATDRTEVRMRLVDSVASFLVNASKANPIMLVLEDLHWADQPSLLLLQHLARRLKGSRLIVVGTYRDIEVDRDHQLSKMLAELRRERLYERVLLRGLSESEVKDLIEAISQQEVASGLGEAFVGAILRETEGNPFFIEETLRHMVEIGSLYRREERWISDAGALVELGVPEGVRDVIGRRLSRLSEATNRVLEAAAVLGREFEFEVLGRMNEPGKDPAWSAIEEGLSNRLVLESRDGGGPRYVFTHALVRQTLVEEMNLPRRRHLHLKAAQAIEAVHEHNLEPHITALANHCRMAGPSVDAEKAIDYSIRAGSAAYAVFAYEEAGAHWRAALELMDEMGGGDRKRRADLLWMLGDEIISSGAEAIEYLESAASLFEDLGDDDSACEVHVRLALFLSTNNVGEIDVPRAMPHFKKAEGRLAIQPESQRHALFYAALAGACIWARQIGDGLAAGKRGMETSQRLNLEGLWSITAALKSRLLVDSGSVTEGLRLLNQARRRADRINDTGVGSGVVLCGAGTYLQLRNPREAQEWCKSELAKPRTAHAVPHAAPNAPRHENVPVLVYHLLVMACIEGGELTKARTYLAEADANHIHVEGEPSCSTCHRRSELLFFQGDWELAGKRMTADYELSRTTGNRQWELARVLDLARLHRFSGEPAQPGLFLQRALEISVEGGDILDELRTRSTLTTMAADAGDAGEALPHLERCRQILGVGENWFGVTGNIECAEAVVAAAQREHSTAEAHFEKAIAIFQHYCLPWEEADTLQYWGRALLAAGERTRAIEKFDAAIEIYRSHGASERFVEYVMADKLRGQN